jgi:chorismate mutase
MAAVLRALRGATTLDEDTAGQLNDRVRALVAAMLERNGIGHDDLVSILFTATGDVTSMFPATAARSLGLGDVPLICASELAITGAMPRCIRVLMHFYTERTRDALHHGYLESARGLRDDLPD